MAGLSAVPLSFSSARPIGAERPTFIDSLSWTISSKFHHLDDQILVEELGQLHFNVLKTPGLRRQASVHNAQEKK